jgi:hypothetical protein
MKAIFHSERPFMVTATGRAGIELESATCLGDLCWLDVALLELWSFWVIVTER